MYMYETNNKYALYVIIFNDVMHSRGQTDGMLFSILDLFVGEATH